MEAALSLSLEQEFNLSAYRQELEGLEESQKDELIIDIMRQLMIKNNVIKHLFSSNPVEI